ANNALIVAGGKSNVGKSGADRVVWRDRIHVLTEPDGHWCSDWQLPRPLAGGVSITTDDGLLLIGGGDGKRHYANVQLIRWDGEKIIVKSLPPLPHPNAFCCGAKLGNTIYIAGGQERLDSSQLLGVFWTLDLSENGDQAAWRKLDTWPGKPRKFAVAAAQDGAFFIFGGQSLDTDGRVPYLADGYRYDPKKNSWSQITDMPRPLSAAATPAPALGQAHIALIGGCSEKNSESGDDAFSPGDVLAYHTITDTWITAGELPSELRIGSWAISNLPATWWQDRFVLPGGKFSSDKASSAIITAAPQRTSKGFTWLDYTMLVIYLGTLVWMGFYFSRREKSTDDFFLGGHRVPWWAAAMSIFGTQLSAITFMATPALVYRTNWVYFFGNMTVVAMVPVFIYFYIPFFKQLNVTTAYEYLEIRFNLTTRLLGSTAFLLFQVGRLGVVLLLPALALSIVTGLNVYACIAVMGILATLYTVLGGIEAVVWTDVLQVIVLVGGALICLIIIVQSIDGGLATVVSMGAASGKFRVANLTWDFATTSLWVVVIGRAMEQLISYGSDQTVVQRYLVTPDMKAAQRAMWTKGALTFVTTFLFFGLGTSLWAFYKTHPQLLNVTGRTDDIFPWFVVQQLPLGLSGVVIAGLLAAAMSSLDSSMNSMATVITTDFYRRFRTNVSDHHCLALARWLTALLGILGTALAMYFAFLRTMSMWDHYIKIIGFFGGGLAGLFIAGIFTRRIHGPGVVVGMFTSAAVLYLVRTYTDVHFFLYAGIGIVSCVTVGYIASLLIPLESRDLKGLTIHTRRREE
ncbi:MAG: sodium/solute symporter, partial [Pirellulales bacterium]|nr:sodium/solute symporter [Pirellulales bacterium]